MKFIKTLVATAIVAAVAASSVFAENVSATKERELAEKFIKVIHAKDKAALIKLFEVPSEACSGPGELRSRDEAFERYLNLSIPPEYTLSVVPAKRNEGSPKGRSMYQTRPTHFITISYKDARKDSQPGLQEDCSTRPNEASQQLCKEFNQRLEKEGIPRNEILGVIESDTGAILAGPCFDLEAMKKKFAQ